MSFRDLDLASIDWPGEPKALEQPARQMLTLLVSPPRRLSQLLQALEASSASASVE